MVDSVRKIAEVLTTLLQDGQAAASITPQDVREALLSTMAPAASGMGFYLDSQYTISSPLSLTGGVRTKLTNNASLSKRVVDMSGAGFDAGTGIILAFDPWNPGTNKVEPDYLDAFCTLQLAFKATTPSANNFLTLEIDVGGATGAFLFQTQLFAKGASVETDFVFNWSIFAGDDFMTNGAELYATADGNADIYEIGITISRIGRPYI